MATTTRFTQTITIAEFADITEFLVGASREDYSTEKMIDLLQKQTEAKQTKFWKYYDNTTFVCDECGKRQWKSKRVHTSKYEICSKECALKSMGVKMTELDRNDSEFLASLVALYMTANDLTNMEYLKNLHAKLMGKVGA